MTRNLFLDNFFNGVPNTISPLKVRTDQKSSHTFTPSSSSFYNPSNIKDEEEEDDDEGQQWRQQQMKMKMMRVFAKDKDMEAVRNMGDGESSSSSFNVKRLSMRSVPSPIVRHDYPLPSYEEDEDDKTFFPFEQGATIQKKSTNNLSPSTANIRKNINDNNANMDNNANIDDNIYGNNSASNSSASLKQQPLKLEDEIIMRFVGHLKKQGVRLVCFDFDQTIVNTSYNHEFRTPANICRRVSPLFTKLGLMLLENGINVSIVTFNINPYIGPAISELLGTKIACFSRNDSETETGKGWHLDNTIKLYNSRMQIGDKMGIRPENVLFLDDDFENIKIAIRSGYNCIHNENVIRLDDLVHYIQEE